MTDRLTWKELSTLKLGACLAFAERETVWTKLGTIIIEPGTVCIIEHQGLRTMWCGLVVRPVDPDLQRSLVFHQEDNNGCIMLAGPETDDASPFLLDDSCPMECI